MPKRIYLSNKTNTAITLEVDRNFNTGETTMLSAFRDSLTGKRIEPGHLTIYFGPGKWSKGDEESLRNLLQHVEVVKNGNPGHFRLPQNLKIGHGIFIQELIVTIKEP